MCTIYIHMYIYRYIDKSNLVATFYPFSQFCEIGICPPSLEKQPKTARNLFQRRVKYGKWDRGGNLAS